MTTDNLTVFGTDYTGVTGIKATGTGNGTLTYIRPTGNLAITSNTASGSSLDVSEYATATVAVPGVTPTGNINITQAGQTDVTNYATATVASASPFMGARNERYENVQSTTSRAWKADVFVEVDASEGDTPGWLPDGYSQVYTFVKEAIPANTTITPSTSSQTIGGANYIMEGAVTVAAMPSGTAGTPSATKGSVSNHAISVTPSVTNTTGYITGGTKTGTAVTVSASELVSGSETKTANGTYDVTNLAELVVNVAGSSKNVQTAQSTSRSTSTSGTQVISLTCSTAGKYTVRWTTFRTSTSGTWGSCLYIGGTAYETMNTTGWNNHIQNREITNVQINANQAVAVYVQSRGTNYYGYVGTLTIIQTA